MSRFKRLVREQSLLHVALAHIDKLIAQRQAEHDDLAHQLRWLAQEKARLLADAARERRP